MIDGQGPMRRTGRDLPRQAPRPAARTAGAEPSPGPAVFDNAGCLGYKVRVLSLFPAMESHADH